MTRWALPVISLDWLRTRDRGFAALRRAGRTALVMPAMFALGDKAIGNTTLATFAAFGSFAMLLLVDFGGSMRERLQSHVALAMVGAVFVCVAIGLCLHLAKMSAHHNFQYLPTVLSGCRLDNRW